MKATFQAYRLNLSRVNLYSVWILDNVFFWERLYMGFLLIYIYALKPHSALCSIVLRFDMYRHKERTLEAIAADVVGEEI